MQRRALVALAGAGLIGAVAAGGALATSTTPGQALPSMTGDLKRRAAAFPQPVRVGDLAGRAVLGPMEAQPLYGRVDAPPVVRGADGTLFLVVTRAGWLGLGAWMGLGGTPAAVPLDDAALLGEHIALVGLTRAELDALPSFRDAGAAPVPADTVIRMGIVGPFH
ncbi:MAG: hypothetical protein JSR21_13850 [Proteobacteria bacterium]|nr:hypothetical protein [Pseudomonadota bacterium]